MEVEAPMEAELWCRGGQLELARGARPAHPKHGADGDARSKDGTVALYLDDLGNFARGQLIQGGVGIAETERQ